MILNITIISLICTGVHVCTGSDKILGFIPDKYKYVTFFFQKHKMVSLRKLSVFLRKPLFECLPCMSSVWTLILWPFFGFGLIYLIPAMFAVCGLNAIISHIIPKEESINQNPNDELH